MKITGNINNMIRPQKTLKKTIIKLYKLGLPALLYGSTNWTIEASDAKRITAVRMIYIYEKNSRIDLDGL